LRRPLKLNADTAEEQEGFDAMTVKQLEDVGSVAAAERQGSNVFRAEEAVYKSATPATAQA
jgi:hypothetical protein